LINKKNLGKISDNTSHARINVKDLKILINVQNSQIKRKTKISKTINKSAKTKTKTKKINYKYNDFELNSFTYKEAIIYDKRTYTKYYISLLKTKHPILFSFVPNKDYNVMIIKICLFFFSFSLYYVINGYFFDEKTIHQIYEEGGEYNLSYFISPIFISFIFAHFLSTVLKYIFLSERNISEIRKEKTLIKAKEIENKVKRTLIIKYIVFFIGGHIFLFFFWYYLSSFGAVYQNTQIFLLINTLISFLISLLYPFIINLLPGIFRMNSLKDKTKKKECIFTFSKILQLL
jgi:hypothetical protein